MSQSNPPETSHGSTLPEIDRLWDFHDPARSETAFREVLPAARTAGDVDYQARLLTQIARAQGLQRQFDQAHATLDDADTLITADMTVARVRYLLERGRVFNSSQQVDRAKPLFVQAWELARESGEDFYAVDAAHMLNICDQGEASLAWAEKAMQAAEASDDPRARKWLGALYNNTGWTYHDMRQYERALDLFEKGLAWRQEQQDVPGARVARWTVARTLRSLGRLREALEMQKALLADYEAAGETDGFVFEELGECLLALGHRDEARPHFARAYEMLSKDEWLKAEEPERLERLKRLAAGGDDTAADN